MTIEHTKGSLSSEAGFQTVQEHPELKTLSIEGNIPEWLEGVLYRTGPGQFEVGEGKKAMKINHWFDGKALNHRFEISGSSKTVTYRSRFACSDQLTREAQQGFSNVPSFSQPYDPCERLYTKFKTAFCTMTGKSKPISASDANVNVVLRFDHQKHSLITSTDNPTLQRIDPTTLEPVEIFQYDSNDSDLAGHLAAAHSADIDGVSYNYVLQFGPRPTYKLFSTDSNGKRKVLTRITDAPAAYLHSLAVTENHIVLTIWQADIGALGLGIPWKNNVLENIQKWSPKRKTIHYVVNRHDGKIVKKVESEPFFCFHHINAYETESGEAIVLDLCTFKDTNIMDYLRIEQARNFDVLTAPMPQYQRIVLHLKQSCENEAPLPRPARLNVGLDLPVINPQYSWRKARYVYGIHHTKQSESRHMFVDAIIKLDLDSHALDDENKVPEEGVDHKVWAKSGLVPGEPIFVPRPGASTEDDGILLTIALDARSQNSMLVIL